MIIGADIIPKFHLWKNFNDILKHKIIILNRDNVNINNYISKYKNKENFIIVKDFKRIDISSTKIRKDIDNNKALIDQEIYKYIKKNKLYL